MQSEFPVDFLLDLVSHVPDVKMSKKTESRFLLFDFDFFMNIHQRESFSLLKELLVVSVGILDEVVYLLVHLFNIVKLFRLDLCSYLFFFWKELVTGTEIIA